MSSVERIICYSHKGLAGQELEKAEFIKDCGMQGDYHADGGDRQITILSKIAKEWMHGQKEEGFCFSKFRENLVVDGINFEKLPALSKLQIDEVILELSPVRKKCYSQFCHLGRSEENCILQNEIRFAKVVEGGILKKGAAVVIRDLL